MIKLICLTPILALAIFTAIQMVLEAKTKFKEWLSVSISLVSSLAIVYVPTYLLIF